MSGYKVNIERKTINGNNYRKVLYTTPQLQLVIMNIEKDIPKEKHPRTTQFVRVEKGTGLIIIDNKRYNVKDGDAVIIPPNTNHYIKNTGKLPLKIYTLYSPPEHADRLIEKTQREEELTDVKKI